MVRAKRLAVLERFDAREQDGRRPVKTTSDSLSPVTTPRVHPKGDSESGSAGASAPASPKSGFSIRDREVEDDDTDASFMVDDDDDEDVGNFHSQAERELYTALKRKS